MARGRNSLINALKPALVIFALAAVECAPAGSRQGDDSKDGEDAGADASVDASDAGTTDSDEGSDEAECAEVTWGGMGSLVAGQIAANIQLKGYADTDGDGTISQEEMVEVQFSLEDIHCTGKKSLIWLMGDYADPFGGSWLSEIKDAVTPSLDEYQSLVMMSVTLNEDELPMDMAAGFAVNYFPGSYFTNEHAPNIQGLPYGAVIELEHMTVLQTGGPGKMSSADLLQRMEQAAGQ